MKRVNKLLIAFASICSVTAIAPLSACSSGAMHTLTLVNENEDGGSLFGAGSYKTGSDVTISYSPNKDYKFDKWDIDGEIIKVSSKTYTFKMPDKDITVTGNFVKKQFEVSVRYDASRLTIIGIGRHDVGSLVTLEAIPAPGYKFSDWEDDSKETISYDPIYTFIMPNRSIEFRAYAVSAN